MTEVRPDKRGWERAIEIAGALLRGGRQKGDSKTRINAILLALVAILGGVVVRGDARTDRLIASLEKLAEEQRASSRESTAALVKAAGAIEESNRFMATLVEKETPKPARKRFVPRPEPRSP